MTYEVLLARIWAGESSSDRQTLRSTVKSLCRKLGDEASNPTYLFNESKVGYRLGTAE